MAVGVIAQVFNWLKASVPEHAFVVKNILSNENIVIERIVHRVKQRCEEVAFELSLRFGFTNKLPASYEHLLRLMIMPLFSGIATKQRHDHCLA